MKVVVTSDHHLGFTMLTRQRLTHPDQLRKRMILRTWFCLGMLLTCGAQRCGSLFGSPRHGSEDPRIEIQRSPVFYVAGNHDYHVLDFNNPNYPITFSKELTLNDGPVTYRFVHGYEFDPEQKTPFMRFLCRVMSDAGGALENQIWIDFNSLNNIFRK